MISPFHGRADLKRPRVCDFGASEKDYGYPLIGRPFIYHKALGSLSECLSFCHFEAVFRGQNAPMLIL